MIRCALCDLCCAVSKQVGKQKVVTFAGGSLGMVVAKVRINAQGEATTCDSNEGTSASNHHDDGSDDDDDDAGGGASGGSKTGSLLGGWGWSKSKSKGNDKTAPSPSRQTAHGPGAEHETGRGAFVYHFAVGPIADSDANGQAARKGLQEGDVVEQVLKQQQQPLPRHQQHRHHHPSTLTLHF